MRCDDIALCVEDYETRRGSAVINGTNVSRHDEGILRQKVVIKLAEGMIELEERNTCDERGVMEGDVSVRCDFDTPSMKLGYL
jgi:hypothetical protein